MGDNSGIGNFPQPDFWPSASFHLLIAVGTVEEITTSWIGSLCEKMFRTETLLWKLDVNANLDHIQGGFRVSPDGRKIAFIRGETSTPSKTPEIWVLENFLSSIPTSK